MDTSRVYLDHNATSPLRPEARAALLAALEKTGNGSSVHAEGRSAHGLIETARDQVAELTGALPSMVVFTSGGTEANNAIIAGAPVERLLVSAIEHDSVRAAARASSLSTTAIPVRESGVIDLEALERELAACSDRALVSVMLANNETGVLQPMDEITEIAHRHGALVHSDAVQGLGKLEVSFAGLDLDAMTVSAHKLGGPQGVGALLVREDLVLKPLFVGGGQERRRRAGTENVAAIASFGAAARAACNEQRQFAADVGVLRDQLESNVREIAPMSRIFSVDTDRLANTSCLALPDISAEHMLMALDLAGIAVSSGSACSSGKVGDSHVLAAMGVPEPVARGAIRVSLGWNSSHDDVEKFCAALRAIILRHRQQSTAA